MTHVSEDQLLLAAYGELPEPDRPSIEAHLAECAECRARFEKVELSRVALDWGLESRPAAGRRRLAWLALPLAAGLGALLLFRVVDRPTVRPSDRPTWQTHLVGSPTAGYVAGGAAFMAIDSQLTNLEKGGIREALRN